MQPKVEAMVKTNYGKHTFQYAATKIWELVPIGIKSLPFYSFKRSYKKYLLLNQNQGVESQIMSETLSNHNSPF